MKMQHFIFFHIQLPSWKIYLKCSFFKTKIWLIFVFNDIKKFQISKHARMYVLLTWIKIFHVLNRLQKEVYFLIQIISNAIWPAMHYFYKKKLMLHKCMFSEFNYIFYTEKKTYVCSFAYFLIFVRFLSIISSENLSVSIYYAKITSSKT